MTAPTPSQTVGPFYGYALPFPGGGDVVPAGHPDAVAIHGVVRDGAGAPIPDALLEFWTGDGAPGSLRRDPTSDRLLGRDGVTLTGFGRVPTDADGSFAVRVARPERYVSVCVFARGLLHHLYTRVYLDPAAAEADFGSLPAARRATLVATAEREGVWRFDVHLQGAEETVFLEFR
ncbi:protocatechuate 3,4-dioxygenase subunit alpha [Catenulispora yoronensis]|uniref:Protocatechuate 3,4-dioxygenase subunit alpha n=1 Tax=Catenulispora yoronensis TaxID=450799 RepID=A0ABN2U5N5_9ACTN